MHRMKFAASQKNGSTCRRIIACLCIESEARRGMESVLIILLFFSVSDVVLSLCCSSGGTCSIGEGMPMMQPFSTTPNICRHCGSQHSTLAGQLMHKKGEDEKKDAKSVHVRKTKSEIQMHARTVKSSLSHVRRYMCEIYPESDTADQIRPLPEFRQWVD